MYVTLFQLYNCVECTRVRFIKNLQGMKCVLHKIFFPVVVLSLRDIISYPYFTDQVARTKIPLLSARARRAASFFKFILFSLFFKVDGPIISVLLITRS